MYTDQDKQRSCEGTSTAFSYEKIYTSPFRNDYSRIIHSPSFRRLQGKTQLFPCIESDYFRNRLTHSLEVASVAQIIAAKINNEYLAKEGPEYLIDLDLVALAGLAHDLGHPPFGHQGEEALDQCMHMHGGFEGNAQTLRLLSKIEKKVHSGELSLGGFNKDGLDTREGLNLTYRALASILKYDQEIPREREKKGKKYPELEKGYYKTESKLVSRIKEHVGMPKVYGEPFKTIECQIMDIADDIAYSTFDLEDVFKSGFVGPLDLLAASPKFYDDISDSVTRALKVNISRDTVIDNISEVFRDLFNLNILLDIFKDPEKLEVKSEEFGFMATQFTTRKAALLAGNGNERTHFSNQLIEIAINNIDFHFNKDQPAFSKVTLKRDAKLRVEVLKQLSFQSQIVSPKLKVAEFRGKEIIKKLFKTLTKNKGYELLPNDVRLWYNMCDDNIYHQRRIICDYIACMTDKYAIEFYGRLTSENPETIFKPF